MKTFEDWWEHYRKLKQLDQMDEAICDVAKDAAKMAWARGKVQLRYELMLKEQKSAPQVPWPGANHAENAVIAASPAYQAFLKEEGESK